MTALATAAIPQIANAVIDPEACQTNHQLASRGTAAAPTKRAGEKTPPNMPNPMQKSSQHQLEYKKNNEIAWLKASIQHVGEWRGAKPEDLV